MQKKREQGNLLLFAQSPPGFFDADWSVGSAGRQAKIVKQYFHDIPRVSYAPLGRKNRRIRLDKAGTKA
jgi:hypothetical protein